VRLVAPLLLTGLLWGAGWILVPSETMAAVLIAAAMVSSANCIRVGRRRLGRKAMAIGLASMSATLLFVTDVLILDRGALTVVHRSARPAAAPDRLRLVDWNVLHGYSDFPDQEQRAALSIDALEALEPDILVLQEAWRTRRYGDLVEQGGHRGGVVAGVEVAGDDRGVDLAQVRGEGRRLRVGDLGPAVVEVDAYDGEPLAAEVQRAEEGDAALVEGPLRSQRQALRLDDGKAAQDGLALLEADAPELAVGS